MKKLFLTLFVAGTLTFGLQSCGEDDPCEGVVCGSGEVCVDGNCEPDGSVCMPCGTFDGTADGSIMISLVGTDTTFSGVDVSADITENATANEYNMAVDISALLDAAPGTLVPDVDGTLTGNTINIVGQTYVYQGIASIDIDGTVVFDSTFDNIDGALTLGDAAVGSVTFSGAKQ